MSIFSNIYLYWREEYKTGLEPRMAKTDLLMTQLLAAISEERGAIEADPDLFLHGFGWHDRLGWAANGERSRLEAEFDERAVCDDRIHSVSP